MLASVVLHGLTQHKIPLLQHQQHLKIDWTERVLDSLFHALKNLEHLRGVDLSIQHSLLLRLLARLAESVLDTDIMRVSQTIAAQRNRSSPASRQSLELCELILERVDGLRTRRTLVRLAVLAAVLVCQDQKPRISRSRVRGVVREVLSVRCVCAQVRVLLKILDNVRALRLVRLDDCPDVLRYLKLLRGSREKNVGQSELSRVWVDSDALDVCEQLCARLVLNLGVR